MGRRAKPKTSNGYANPGVRASLERSIKAGVEAGRIDREVHAAVIAGARLLANIMDAPNFPFVNGKVDNVTPSKFLEYCARLGIAAGAPGSQSGGKPKGKLATVSDLQSFRETGTS